MTEKRWLSCAETAKLVRKALKDEFSGVTFYVRSKTYAGGASIDVSWVDGPTTKEVDVVLKPFEGKSFDGSIDMACHWNHWLLPDGSVQVAKGPGTEGSLGYIGRVDNPKPHPDAELVSLGADYVSGSRSTTRQLLEKLVEKVQAETGWPAPEILDYTSYLTRTKKVQTAYFKRDWTVKVPGSDQELEQFYNRRLWEFSDYERENDEPGLVLPYDGGSEELDDQAEDWDTDHDDQGVNWDGLFTEQEPEPYYTTCSWEDVAVEVVTL